METLFYVSALLILIALAGIIDNLILPHDE